METCSSRGAQVPHGACLPAGLGDTPIPREGRSYLWASVSGTWLVGNRKWEDEWGVWGKGKYVLIQTAESAGSTRDRARDMPTQDARSSPGVPAGT